MEMEMVNDGPERVEAIGVGGSHMRPFLRTSRSSDPIH